jgi:threonine dehydratase
MRITLEQFEEARVLLRQYFAPTPLVPARSLGDGADAVFLKVETGLPTGSFKVRGAIYALSIHLRTGTPTEVTAASTGNHGAAVAWAAGLLHLPATIFVPRNPNPVKAQRIRDLGARLVEVGEIGADLAAAIDAANEYADRAGAFFLHDASSPLVPIGAGTIGLEVVESLPSVQTMYVPMGDTALIRGVASAAKHLVPGVRIVGVVAERAPAYFLSWQRRLAVETASALTIADGLAVRRALQSNVDDICALVDDVVCVSEQEMLAAIRRLMREEQIEAEPAGAAALAGIFLTRDQADTARSPSAGTSVALVTGGNLAPDLRAELAAHGGGL